MSHVIRQLDVRLHIAGMLQGPDVFSWSLVAPTRAMAMETSKGMTRMSINVDFKENDTLEAVARALSRGCARHVTSLSLTHRHVDEYDILSLLNHFDNLEHIDVTSTSPVIQTLVGAHARSIKTLTVILSSSLDGGLGAVVSSCKNLESIWLRECGEFHPDFFRHLVFHGPLPKLQGFYVEDCDLSEEDNKAMMAVVRALRPRTVELNNLFDDHIESYAREGMPGVEVYRDEVNPEWLGATHTLTEVRFGQTFTWSASGRYHLDHLHSVSISYAMSLSFACAVALGVSLPKKLKSLTIWAGNYCDVGALTSFFSAIASTGRLSVDEFFLKVDMLQYARDMMRMAAEALIIQDLELVAEAVDDWSIGYMLVKNAGTLRNVNIDASNMHWYRQDLQDGLSLCKGLESLRVHVTYPDDVDYIMNNVSNHPRLTDITFRCRRGFAYTQPLFGCSAQIVDWVDRDVSDAKAKGRIKRVLLESCPDSWTISRRPGSETISLRH